MAGPDRGPSPGLKLDLKLAMLREGHDFSFYQAVRLLRHFASRPAEKNWVDKRMGQAIHITPKLSLAFPASDIDRIDEFEPEAEGDFSIVVNFFSLYGTASPLPTFYTEELIEEEHDEESVSRDFLDIFHRHLYRLLYKSWLKYRQFLQVSEEQDFDAVQRLFCLLGLGETEFQNDVSDAYSLLRYTGLFAQSPRSALGLKILLQDALDLPIDIEPCLLRKAKIPIDQRIALGRNQVGLGNDSFLGEELDDRMGKFRIKVGPLSEPEYRDFFPGSAMYNKLVQLTDLFVLDSLEYDIKVTMKAREAQTVCLGSRQWAGLGLDTWIYSGRDMGSTSSLFYPHQKVQ